MPAATIPAPKENQKKLLEIFTPFLIGCKKAYKNFRTNHSVGSSLRQQKELSRNFRVNKKFRYSELLSSAPDRKREADQNGKKNIKHSYASSKRSFCYISRNLRFYKWEARTEMYKQKYTCRRDNLFFCCCFAFTLVMNLYL